MQIAKKIRLYPNKKQEELFWQFAGTSRWAWNESLAYRMARYDKDKSNTTVQQGIEHIQDLKYNNSDYDWVNSVPEAITKQAIKDLDKAYKSFFKSGFGKPKFKKRGKCKDSFYQRTDKFRQVDETHIKITGIKTYIKIRKFTIPNKVYNTRISYDGKYWYLSYTYEKEVIESEKQDIVLGVDLGIEKLAVISDGREYANINKGRVIKNLEKRKKRLQRQLSRKYEMNKEGNKYVKTKNIEKLERRIRLIDRRMRNIRDTYIHEVTKDLVRTKPKRIVIEDLDISGMMKNKYIAKSIQDQCLYKFRQYITYKCKLYTIELGVADRYYASSQICSRCGNIMKMPLSKREYRCNKCGLIIDRDYNASINLSRC